MDGFLHVAVLAQTQINPVLHQRGPTTALEMLYAAYPPASQ